jgi:hypothetical protein
VLEPVATLGNSGDSGEGGGDAPANPFFKLKSRRNSVTLVSALSLEERLEAEIADHNIQVAAVVKLQAAWRGTLARRARDAGTLTPTTIINTSTSTSAPNSDTSSSAGGKADSGGVRCAFFDRNLHSRMPLDPTHVRFKRTCV